MKRRKSIKTMLVAVVLLVSLLIPPMAAYADEPSWTTLASMSIARKTFQTIVANEKIYAIGGSDSSSLDIYDSTEVYDPDTNTWTTLASMSIPRRYFQTEVINGAIYAIGGLDDSNECISSVECYIPAS